MSITPADAPVRPAYVKDADGNYYRIGGGGGGLDQATADNLYVNHDGDTMTGDLSFEPGAKVSVTDGEITGRLRTGWLDPFGSGTWLSSGDGGVGLYSSDRIRLAADNFIEIFSTKLDLRGSPIVGVGDPVDLQDAATKQYVDNAVGVGGGGDVMSTRKIDSGAGLIGGGDLTADRTLAVGAGTGITVAADSIAVDTTTIQSKSEKDTASGYAGLVAGKLAYAQLPTGTAASTVAIGDHTHTSSTISALDTGDITTGTFTIGRIPTGTTSTTVSLGDHTHAGGSYLAITGGTLTGALNFNTAAGTGITFMDAASTRWGISRNSSNELLIDWYNDSGINAGNVMKLKRFAFGIDFAIAGNFLDGLTASKRIDATASTTSYASLRLPHGVAPTGPSNGEVWTTTAGLYVRINGATVGPLGAGGGGGLDQTTADNRYVNLTGDTMTGSLSINPVSSNADLTLATTDGAYSDTSIYIDAPAGQYGTILFRSGTAPFKTRWMLQKGGGSETGSNVGSDLTLTNHSDAGGLLGTVLNFKRSTGLITVYGDPTAALGIATKQYVDARTPKVIAQSTAPADTTAIWVDTT